MKTIAIILGTRPEIIKLAPIIAALRPHSEFRPLVIASGQHREMAAQAFQALNLKPDVDLQLMEVNQRPDQFLGTMLHKIGPLLDQHQPSGIIIQGDTSTTLGGALSAFHREIPIAHVEAGLRTNNLKSPFPEEMNRSLVSKLADIHFCPTESNKINLLQESITTGVYVVGNTVVDTLQWMVKQLESGKKSIQENVLSLNLDQKSFVLVTGHRRENHQQPLRNLCKAIFSLAEHFPEIEIIYPVHRNPNVEEVVLTALSHHPRVHLLPPVDYPTQVYLMKEAKLIISDSGGIQEEAPSLGTPLLVTRKTTERPEAILAKTAVLADLDNSEQLLELAINTLNQRPLEKPSLGNPFGDGESANRIVSILSKEWSQK